MKQSKAKPSEIERITSIIKLMKSNHVLKLKCKDLELELSPNALAKPAEELEFVYPKGTNPPKAAPIMTEEEALFWSAGPEEVADSKDEYPDEDAQH